MRPAVPIALLAALALAAPAQGAAWSPPRELEPGQAVAGLEPAGDGYLTALVGQGRASVFALPQATDLSYFEQTTASVLLAGDGRGRTFAAAEHGAGTVLVRQGDEITTAPVGRAAVGALGTDGTAVIGDGTTFALAGDPEPFVPTTERVLAADAAVAHDGTAVIVVAIDGEVRLYERDGEETTLTRLASFDAVGGVPAVSVATGRRRALAVVWTQPRFRRVRAELFARTRTDRGVLGPVQALDASPLSDMAPQVAIAPSGRAVAAWLAGSPREVRSAFSAVGPGTFGPPLRVSPRQHRDAAALDLAVDNDGRAIAAWSAGCFLCDSKAYVADATAKGRLKRPRVLSRLGALAAGPHVALDGRRGAAAAWTQDGAGVATTTARLPGTGPRDRRPPRVRARATDTAARAIRTGVLRVGLRCDEACATGVELRGAQAAGTRLVLVPEVTARVREDVRRRGYARLRYAATDTAGNVTRGALRIR